MQHARDLRPPLQPAGEGERGSPVAGEADGERPQAAQAEIAVVRPGTDAEQRRRPPDRQERLLVGGDHPEHRVGVADEILGRRLDRDVHPVAERLEVAVRPLQVLSSIETAPCGTRRSGGARPTSCTSKVSEPGLSR